MKKYYLPLLCMGLFSTAAFSQNTYVTGNVPVKVQPNTLFYHGGNFVVSNGVTANGTIKNDGNIRIVGNFDNSTSPAGATGANFLNTWTSEASYGQVIINQAATSAGFFTMQKRGINPASFTWGQFAIPYEFATVGQAYQTLFGIPYVGGNRYNHSIMTWDNTTRPEFDHIASGTAINPTDYVILNLNATSPLYGVMGTGAATMNYAGKPANKNYSVSYNVSMYEASTVPWNTWKDKRNIYSEKYSTYIEEHLRTANTADHGRYYFQFGNPYTSNIDLSRIGTDGDSDNVFVENLMGVVKITSTSWNEGAGVVFAGVNKVQATWDGSTWAGNSNALLIKPFESFIIGLNANATRSTRTFNFNDGLKTFSNAPQNGGTTTPLGRFSVEPELVSNDDATTAEDRAYNGNISNTIGIGGGSSRTSFYQLGLSLFTENDIHTGNTVYVVVDSNSKSGMAQPLEADYSDYQNGFFLTQEKSDGSEITVPNRTMQINAVNPKYASKPIQLFYKKKQNDTNGYYLKSELFFRDIFNKLNIEDGNFTDGNSFFFYDKAQDVLLPITTDFSYYIERPEEVQNSRYVVYWNGGPENTSPKMDISEEMGGLTQVYKDGKVHKIRFNENWNSADISVYDLSGRSIFKKEGVKTDVDYVLNLPNTSTYVVKIQSNTGEVVTQKIIR